MLDTLFAKRGSRTREPRPLPFLIVVCGLFLSDPAWARLDVVEGALRCDPYDCSVQLEPSERLELRTTDIGPVAAVLRDGEPVRYYFLSSDIVDMPAYSGNPIEILVGLDPQGRILEARLVHHKEPILLVGIPERKLRDFIARHVGWDIRTRMVVGPPQPGVKNVDIVTGATVTVLVAHQTIEQSARKVAAALGLIEAVAQRHARLTTTYTPYTWNELLEMGAIGHLRVEPQEMGLPPSDEPWLDLYFADVRHPSIGRNLLGDHTYRWLLRELKPHETAIVIVNDGTWSFKGSGFVRGGIFDRFRIEQGLVTVSFRDLDYENLYELAPEDAPDYRESGIFIVRNPEFDPTRPWELVVVSSRLTGETATSKMFKTFRARYQLPERFLERERGLVEKIWSEKRLEIGWYVLLWLIVVGIFVFRKQVAATPRRLEVVHTTVLIVALVTIGIVQRGQPSVVNIFTLIDVIRKGGSFKLFFTDPFLAVGWIFILVTTLVWGRSVFCGWLCPYGALQELLFKLRKWLTPWKRSYEFPPRVRKGLRPLRYGIFLVLLAISLVSIELAEVAAEVEPFKTTWNVGVWNRPLVFGIYWTMLLVAALITERFFCRYLCPLGGALSFLSLRPLVPIPRRNYCTKCVKCAKRCSVFAIDFETGAIDPKECLGCFECIERMYNPKECPPLVSEKIWLAYEANDPKAPPKR